MNDNVRVLFICKTKSYDEEALKKNEFTNREQILSGEVVNKRGKSVILLFSTLKVILPAAEPSRHQRRGGRFPS